MLPTYRTYVIILHAFLSGGKPMLSQNDISPELIELIKAIAGLWALVATLGFLIFVFLFRNEIKVFLKRISRFSLKRGNTELSIEKQESYEEKSVSHGGDKYAEPQDVGSENKEIFSETRTDSDLRFDMLDGFLAKDFTEAEKAYKQLQSVEEDINQKLRNEVIYCYLRYVHADDKSVLSRIRDIANNPSVSSFAHYWMAECYKHNREYKEAKGALQSAIEASKDDEARARNIASMVDLSLEMGEIDEALAVASQGLQIIKEEKLQLPLYRSLAAVFKAKKDEFSQAIALEKATSLEPEDKQLRLEAAFALSNVNFLHSAAINYDIILRQQPNHALAFNNIGVIARDLNLPIKSVEFYRDAAKDHETLAMANLAYLYIDKGFIDEAKQILHEAQKEQVVHPNVNQALAFISNEVESENNKWAEIIQTGIRQKSFLQSYAEAYFFPATANNVFSGTWLQPDGVEVQMIQSEGQISAEWGSGSNKRKLEGSVIHRSAKINIKKWLRYLYNPNADPNSGFYSDGETGLAYVDVQREKLQIALISNKSTDFMVFIRPTNNAEKVHSKGDER